jgi:hypothetical protein
VGDLVRVADDLMVDRRRRRMALGTVIRRLLTAALVASVVAGCRADPTGALFRTTVGEPESYDQEVVLGDRTGLVVGLEPYPILPTDQFDPPSVSIDPDDPNTLVYRWANGACDRPAISFARSGDRFVISVNPRGSLGPCMAILLFRAVRIRLSEPIAPDRIDLPVAR